MPMSNLLTLVTQAHSTITQALTLARPQGRGWKHTNDYTLLDNARADLEEILVRHDLDIPSALFSSTQTPPPASQQGRSQ